MVAVIHQLLADLTDHVLHLDMGFHKGTNPGTLIEQIDGDVTALSNFFSSMIIKVLGNSGLLIGILILLWMESWMVGLRSRCSPQAHSWDSSGYTV